MNSEQQELRSTAIHEAGHAVIQFVLGLGQEGATIVPDEDTGLDGSATHGSMDYLDRMSFWNEQIFLFLQVIADYAGLEAQRQIFPQDDDEDRAEDDYDSIHDRITTIANMDDEEVDLWYKLAKRRVFLMVKYYRPEIEAVSAALMDRRTLSGDEVRELIDKSLLSRGGGI